MRICFYRFLHVILHEGRSCPELQNPLYQKAKENLLPGEKVPIRADEGGWGLKVGRSPHPIRLVSGSVPPSL